ncbi:diguanylate cyclase [Mycoplasmatota bacterium WC44]
MNPIYLLLLNLFGVFLLINENVLIEKLSKFKLIIAFFNLLVSFVLVFSYSVIVDNDIYNLVYNVFIFLNILFFAYGLFATIRLSGLKGNYYQLFIKSLKEIKKNVFLIVDENEKIVDISDSFLEDMDIKKGKVIGKRFIDIVNKTIKFKEMNEKPIDNNYVEQYYIRYGATIKSQKATIIEYKYKNASDHLEIIHIVEKPMFINSKYKGRIMLGEKISSTEQVKSKLKHQDLLTDYNDLQSKFVSTLEMTQEGIFYLTEQTNEIWGTDRLKEIMNLDMNVANIDDIIHNIHPNDLDGYLKRMKIKEVKNEYKVTYRYRSKSDYKWLIEEGKKISTKDGDITIGVVREIDSRNVIKKVSLPDDIDLKLDIKKLLSKEKPFGLLRINIDQVKQFTVQYGRQTTNHLVEEFVKKLKRNYQRETSRVYELHQYEYAVLIDDSSDLGVVKKSLLSNSNLFNLNIEMGAIKINLIPSIGVVEYPQDTAGLDEIITSAEQAVNMAKKSHYKSNFCFYKDIHDVFV